MNRKKVRNLIREVVRNYISLKDSESILEYEIFGANAGDLALIDAYKNGVFENPQLSDNLDDALDKRDPNAFTKIVESFCDEITDEKEITDEFCDSLIAEVQSHFAGMIMFGDNFEKEDHLFVYEPFDDINHEQ